MGALLGSKVVQWIVLTLSTGWMIAQGRKAAEESVETVKTAKPWLWVVLGVVVLNVVRMAGSSDFGGRRGYR